MAAAQERRAAAEVPAGVIGAAAISRVPQSTAKPPSTERKVPQSTAKSPGFAVLTDDELEDSGDDFNSFAGLDAKEWRIETRYRLRKDGKEIIYWNYRRRKIHHDADGNRRIEYRKGGSRER